MFYTLLNKINTILIFAWVEHLSDILSAFGDIKFYYTDTDFIVSNSGIQSDRYTFWNKNKYAYIQWLSSEITFSNEMALLHSESVIKYHVIFK